MFLLWGLSTYTRLSCFCPFKSTCKTPVFWLYAKGLQAPYSVVVPHLKSFCFAEGLTLCPEAAIQLCLGNLPPARWFPAVHDRNPVLRHQLYATLSSGEFNFAHKKAGTLSNLCSSQFSHRICILFKSFMKTSENYSTCVAGIQLALKCIFIQ